MGTTHTFADNSYGIGHNTGDYTKCPCGAQKTATHKQSSSGRGGRHQGYKVASVTVKHNALPVTAK